MSTTKTIGALAGLLVGLGVAALLTVGALKPAQLPGSLDAAVLILGAFLGAGLGAYIGSADLRG